MLVLPFDGLSSASTATANQRVTPPFCHRPVHSTAPATTTPAAVVRGLRHAASSLRLRLHARVHARSLPRHLLPPRLLFAAPRHPSTTRIHPDPAAFTLPPATLLPPPEHHLPFTSPTRRRRANPRPSSPVAPTPRLVLRQGHR